MVRKYEPKSVCPAEIQRALDLINAVPLGSKAQVFRWLHKLMLRCSENIPAFMKLADVAVINWLETVVAGGEKLNDVDLARYKKMKLTVSNAQSEIYMAFPDTGERALIAYLLQRNIAEIRSSELGSIHSELVLRHRWGADPETGKATRGVFRPEMGNLERSFRRTIQDLREQKNFINFLIHLHSTSNSDEVWWGKYASYSAGVRDVYVARKGGKIISQQYDLVQLIERHGKGLERIGDCPSCGKIYWKKKLNASTCSVGNCRWWNQRSEPARANRTKKGGIKDGDL